MINKSRWLAVLGVVFALSVGLGLFAACGENDKAAVKPSDYVDGVNCYYGDGEDVHVRGWYGSIMTDGLYTVKEQSDGSTLLHYYNDTAWRDFRFSMDGPYSDFGWLNITMKRGGDPVVAFVKIVNPIRESHDNPNALGPDIFFELTEEYVTYSFAVPAVHRQILDIADIVCLFPDPGTTGTYGDIYIEDAWFSKAQPEGSSWVNDTDSSNNAGWSAESWTGYSIRSAKDAELRLSFNQPAEWAGAFRPISLPADQTVNKLTFVFSSDAYNGAEDTIENIVFSFRGDQASWNDAGWWNYYEQRLYVYNKGSVQPDENGDITLEIPIDTALAAMEGQHEKQLLLGLNIESCPEFDNYDGKGQMTVKSVTLSYDENIEDLRPEPSAGSWHIVPNGEDYYTISESGKVTNVSYTDVPGNLWANLYLNPAGVGTKKASILLRNNGDSVVNYKVQFDGESATSVAGTLAAGEEKAVEAVPAKEYSALNLWLDGCTNDAENKYSGNVDVLSVTFEDAAGPDKPIAAWRCDTANNPFAFSLGQDGLWTVTYSAAPGWTTIVSDFIYTAAESSNLVFTVQNNNDFAVKMRFDLMGLGENNGWVTVQQGALTEIPALGTRSIEMRISAGTALAGLLGFVDPEGTEAGSVTIHPVEVGPAPQTVPAPEWKCDKPEHPYSFTENGDGTWTVDYSAATQWKNILTNFVFTVPAGGTLLLPVANNNDFDIVVRFDLMTDSAEGWVTLMQGDLVTVAANSSVNVAFTLPAGGNLAGILGFIDPEGTGAGSVTLSAVAFTPAGEAAPDTANAGNSAL